MARPGRSPSLSRRLSTTNKVKRAVDPNGSLFRLARAARWAVLDENGPKITLEEFQALLTQP